MFCWIFLLEFIFPFSSVAKYSEDKFVFMIVFIFSLISAAAFDFASVSDEPVADADKYSFLGKREFFPSSVIQSGNDSAFLFIDFAGMAETTEIATTDKISIFLKLRYFI